MAEMTRLLGFTPVTGLDTLRLALNAVPGPALHVRCSPSGPFAVAALLQDEPDAPLTSRSREELAASLQCVQRRLEIACLAGPFLPMDPAASCCPDAAVPRLLESAWEALAGALHCHGASHQWDIVLRWTAEHVVARSRSEIAAAAGQGPQMLAEAVAAVLRAECSRREQALLSALRPAVLGFAEGGAIRTDTQVAVTVLAASNNEAAIEAALDALAPEYTENATIDMRGPLPALSFNSVRLVTVQAQHITDAWHSLDLPDSIDLTILHQQWRLRAAAVHPDRLMSQSGLVGAPTVSDLTHSHRLLRDLLPTAAGKTATLTSLLRAAGPRLIVPASDMSPLPQPVGNPAGVSEPAFEMQP